MITFSRRIKLVYVFKETLHDQCFYDWRRYNIFRAAGNVIFMGYASTGDKQPALILLCELLKFLKAIEITWEDMVNCFPFTRRWFVKPTKKLYFIPWISKEILSFYPHWIHDLIKTQSDAATSNLWDLQVEIQLINKAESFADKAAEHACLS